MHSQAFLKLLVASVRPTIGDGGSGGMYIGIAAFRSHSACSRWWRAVDSSAHRSDMNSCTISYSCNTNGVVTLARQDNKGPDTVAKVVAAYRLAAALLQRVTQITRVLCAAIADLMASCPMAFNSNIAAHLTCTQKICGTGIIKAQV